MKPRDFFLQELPPRARRIPHNFQARDLGPGTTSACAENTQVPWLVDPEVWNYLRVRGEYLAEAWYKHVAQELPPRARRILRWGVNPTRCIGTTSACAENTTLSCWNSCSSGNYLRVRGEYTAKRWIVSAPAELPPRARRILV